MAGYAVCMGPVKAALRSDARLILPAEPTGLSCESVKRCMYWCHKPAVEGTWRPVVHSSCVHNELAGLLVRTLGPTPDYVSNRWLEQEWRRLRLIVKKTPVTRLTLERVVAGYSGRLHRRYVEALESLRIEPELTSRDRRLTSFVKAEKVCPYTQSVKKPRMINARSPRFNLLIASYLKPVEGLLWRSIVGDCPGVAPTRQVAKGLGPRERASIIKLKMEGVGEGTVVFEVDGSRFEAHVTRRDLLDEHSVYKAAYPGDVELRDLLQTQLVLQGRTFGGIRFRREGCRASGDFNTGLGNTLIMIAAVRATVHLMASRVGHFRYDLLADGDNCLIFVEPAFATRVVGDFRSTCREVSAQELVVERPVTRLEEVVFGQSHPVWCAEGWQMVRDVRKTLSNAFSGHRHFNEWTFGVRVLKATARCELYLARGVPVMQAYFSAAVERLAHVPDLPDPRDFLEGASLDAIRAAGSWQAVISSVTVPVTAASRQSFEAAFGISGDEQVLLESRLRAHIGFPDRYGFRWSREVLWAVLEHEVDPQSDSLYWDAQG